jgi:hypothetical protein
MSALHSLHTFLSPAVDAEFGVELCRDGVDRLIAAHADDIAGHLRRSLAAAASASSRCVEERLLAVMVAGLVLLWSKESCAIVREKLLDVLARHTLVGGTDDDGDDSQAEPERVGGHHDVVNSDDLRAAVRSTSLSLIRSSHATHTRHTHDTHTTHTRHTHDTHTHTHTHDTHTTHTRHTHTHTHTHDTHTTHTRHTHDTHTTHTQQLTTIHDRLWMCWV